MLPFPIMNNYGNILPPRGSIKEIKGSGQSGGTLAMLLNNGRLYMTGTNGSGAFGIGSTATQPNWVLVATDVREFDLNDSATIYISTTGKVMGAGSLSTALPSSGIANSTTWVDYSAYFSTAGTISSFKKIYIDAWGYRCFVINGSDTLYGSGSNNYYASGRGSNSGSSTLGAIVNGTNAKHISTAYYASTMIKNDGTVWLCGTNTRYQILSTSNTATRSQFTQVTAPTTMESSAMSEYLTMFIATNGSVYALGLNNSGEAGIAPGNLTGITSCNLSGIKYINRTGTIYHNTVLGNSTAFSAGDNGGGRLGTGSGAISTGKWTACSIGSIVLSDVIGIASTVNSTIIYTDKKMYMAGTFANINAGSNYYTFVECQLPF